MMRQDTPGVGGDTFNLYLASTYYERGDVLILGTSGKEFEVLESPTPHYNKWYWRVLNWLTFKIFFNVVHTYKVRIKDD